MESTNVPKHTSELSRFVTEDKFEKAFIKFLDQADKNAITQNPDGLRVPYGFTTTRFDGADLSCHFGQGRASKTPYMNWWVLSIYYIVESQNIIMGIEEHRYPHLKQMHPSRTKRIGNKSEDIAVFYSTTKNNIDYSKLYERFISVAEEIMKLGLK